MTNAKSDTSTFQTYLRTGFLSIIISTLVGSCADRTTIYPTVRSETQTSLTRQADSSRMDTILPPSRSPADTAFPMMNLRADTSSRRNTLSGSRRKETMLTQSGWTKIPGSVSQMVLLPQPPGFTLSFSFFALSDSPIGSDKFIYEYTSDGTWVNIPGLASRIAVGSDGTLYAINSAGGVYHYASGSWTSLGGGAKDIAVDVTGTVYVITNAASTDGAIWQNKNGSWSQLPGTGVRLASNPDSVLYVISSNGSIFSTSLGQPRYALCPGKVSSLAPVAGAGFVALSFPLDMVHGSPIYQFAESASYGGCLYGSYSQVPGYATDISVENFVMAAVSSDKGAYVTFAPLLPRNPTATPAPDSTLPPSSVPIHRLAVSVEYNAPPPNHAFYDFGRSIDGKLWINSADFPANGPQLAVDEYALFDPAAVLGSQYTFFNAPVRTQLSLGAAAGGDNALYVINAATTDVWRFAATGFTTTQIGKRTDSITAGADNSLWVYSQDWFRTDLVTGAVSEFHIQDNSLRFYPSGSGAVDGSGNITYVSDELDASHAVPFHQPIVSVSARGLAKAIVEDSGLGYQDTKSTTVFDRVGNLWIADCSHFSEGMDFASLKGYNHASIVKMTPGGVFTRFPLDPGHCPSEITALGDGSIWFLDFILSNSDGSPLISKMPALLGYLSPAGVLAEMALNITSFGDYGSSNGVAADDGRL